MNSGLPRSLNFIGICGSLRAASYNRLLLQAAAGMLPEQVSMEMVGLDGIEVYNDDVWEKGFPPPVEALRQKVRAADAVVFAVPEYNFSVSGALKNAFDWLSRPPDQVFDDKPIAMIGASLGPLGTARAQYHLRQMCVRVNAHPLNLPEIFVGNASLKFDVDGRLIDEVARGLILQQMRNLAAWTIRLGSGKANADDQR